MARRNSKIENRFFQNGEEATAPSRGRGRGRPRRRQGRRGGQVAGGDLINENFVFSQVMNEVEMPVMEPVATTSRGRGGRPPKRRGRGGRRAAAGIGRAAAEEPCTSATAIARDRAAMGHRPASPATSPGSSSSSDDMPLMAATRAKRARVSTSPAPAPQLLTSQAVEEAIVAALAMARAGQRKSLTVAK